MKRLLSLGACLAVLVPAAAMAQAFYNYFGPHPVSPGAGSGFCYNEGSHGHEYPIDPNIAYLYRTYNNHHHFVGNVYHFGYQRQAFPYYGNHPLGAELGGGYCYLDGNHYHQFTPPVSYASNYLVHNGYYYYNGTFPQLYYQHRPMYYRSAYTYAYLPSYLSYYSNYGTYVTSYGTPASVSYIYNRPAGAYSYSRVPSRVYYPRGPVTTYTSRTYTTTRRTPVYRYNTYRPSTYNVYYRRPVYNAPTYRTPVYRGPATVSRTTTTTYRPVGGVTRVTTTRTWRR
jgi:hypothetical protein